MSNELRPLGRHSGVETTQLGAGTTSVGDMYERISDGQALDSLHAAYKGGIK